MTSIKSLLMICTGNTARSPAAEYLAKFYAKKYGLDLHVESAGFINAFSYMQPESKEYLDTKGIKSSDFRPQLINNELVEQQDLIITMEISHKKDIIRNFSNIPNIKQKTFTLKEYNEVDGNPNIIDPYYTSYDVYKEVLKTIDENVEKMIKKIIQRNQI